MAIQYPAVGTSAYIQTTIPSLFLPSNAFPLTKAKQNGGDNKSLSPSWRVAADPLLWTLEITGGQSFVFCDNIASFALLIGDWSEQKLLLVASDRPTSRFDISV